MRYYYINEHTQIDTREFETRREAINYFIRHNIAIWTTSLEELHNFIDEIGLSRLAA